MRLLTTDYPSLETVGHYRIDAGRRMQIEEYQGKVGRADLKAMSAAMVSDPCWSPDFHGLVDFSEAELDLSANDVLRLALVMRHEAIRRIRRTCVARAISRSRDSAYRQLPTD
jgi:hypothetical protein